jgi:hypothetical protein
MKSLAVRYQFDFAPTLMQSQVWRQLRPNLCGRLEASGLLFLIGQAARGEKRGAEKVIGIDRGRRVAARNNALFGESTFLFRTQLPSRLSQANVKSCQLG